MRKSLRGCNKRRVPTPSTGLNYASVKANAGNGLFLLWLLTSPPELIVWVLQNVFALESVCLIHQVD